MQSVDIDISRASRPLLVASTGGHLEQLHLFARRWGLLGGGARWVTFASDQSVDLLQGEDVTWVDYVRPRDWRGTIRVARTLTRLVTTQEAGVLVSTGAAVAVATAVAGIRSRTRVVYIETLARVGGLSLTGRILAGFPRIERYTQSPQLAGDRYRLVRSVLESYAVHPLATPTRPKRVLVTLGTIRPYGFDRLLKRLDEVLEGFDVVWQVGESTYVPSRGDVYRTMPRHELLAATMTADVVVAHAGVGSILTALAAGRVPVVVPRLASHGEHVDDHQQEIAALASGLGYAIRAEADSISTSHLEMAASLRSVRVDEGEE